MRGTRVALFVHLIWGTWDRLPLLNDEIEREVYRCIEVTCAEHGAEMLALGGVMDHVHLLVRLPATVTVADLMKSVKGASAHLVTHELAPGNFFKWQGGYAAFSAGLPQIAPISEYIKQQKVHHGVGSLIAEWEAEPEPQVTTPLRHEPA